MWLYIGIGGTLGYVGIIENQLERTMENQMERTVDNEMET